MGDKPEPQQVPNYQVDPQRFAQFLLHYISQGTTSHEKNEEVVNFFNVNPHLSTFSVEGTGTLLHHSVDCKNYAIMLLLLEQGADINAVIGRGISPLGIAIQQQSQNTVRLLLDAGATVGLLPGVGASKSCLGLSMNPNYYSLPIFRAVFKKLHEEIGNDPEQIAALIHDADGRLPHAAYSETAELVVKRMVQHHQHDVNSTVKPGTITALYVAAQVNNVALGRWLLANSANVDLGTDLEGRKALYWAMYNSSEDMVSLLVKNGAENFRTE